MEVTVFTYLKIQLGNELLFDIWPENAEGHDSNYNKCLFL